MTFVPHRHLLLPLFLLMITTTPLKIKERPLLTPITGSVGLRKAISAWCSDKAAAEAEFGPITDWDTVRVKDMSNLVSTHCATTSTFNADLSSWDVSNVEDMHRMFRSASAFNSDISRWDVSSVENMNGMFDHAVSFAQDISSWNMTSVQDLGWMFCGATSFNIDVSAWNITSARSMSFMFYGATSFSQSLCWDLSHVTFKHQMFEDSGGGSVRDEENCEREQHMEQQQQCRPLDLDRS